MGGDTDVQRLVDGPDLAQQLELHARLVAVRVEQLELLVLGLVVVGVIEVLPLRHVYVLVVQVDDRQ